MSQCKCIAAEAARFCTHISTPPKLASSSPQMWRTVSASSSWHDGAAPASFLRGTQCGIAHQCARASTPVPVSSACQAWSRRGGSGASSVGRRGCMGADRSAPSWESLRSKKTRRFCTLSSENLHGIFSTVYGRRVRTTHELMGGPVCTLAYLAAIPRTFATIALFHGPV